MIVLDLEWNQPFGGRRMEEIIQIGAVRLARPGGPVVDAFNAHIRPSIYRKLSPVAKKLPESAQALTSELDFPTVHRPAGGLRPDAGDRPGAAYSVGAGGGVLRPAADL